MIVNILSHTPVWVWGLLAALLALGITQLRTRRVHRARVLALPLVLLGIGLWTQAPVFAAHPGVAGVWALALAGLIWLGLRLPLPAGARWLADEQRLLLPGSWLPLALIVAVFCLRYGVAVMQALDPAWRSDLHVLLPVAALYGAISGLLLGRALRLLQLTMPSHGAAPAGHERGIAGGR